jgi:Uma2 family endonuclease
MEEPTMATVDEPTPGTLEELVDRLGGIPLSRILTRPAPGTATEEDLLAALKEPEKRICELVDGVLVEKAMGTREALLAGLIVYFFWEYLRRNKIGKALGADGMLRLMPGLVRVPDVSFLSKDRLPDGQIPDQAIAPLAPDLAVEVVSKSNTRKEIQRKIKEYFLTGARLVWVIYPKRGTAESYTAPDVKHKVGKQQALDGGDVLPGFRLSLKELFEVAEE